jgi:hypothetical protein
VQTGRPGLSEERERELGGAPARATAPTTAPEQPETTTEVEPRTEDESPATSVDPEPSTSSTTPSDENIEDPTADVGESP